MNIAALIVLTVFVVFAWQSWCRRPRVFSRWYQVGALIALLGLWNFPIQIYAVNLVPRFIATPISIGISDFDLDEDGNIYVGSDNGRVQVFDAYGRFMHAINIASDTVHIRIVQGGVLLRGDGNRFYRFDRQGLPVALSADGDQFDYEWSPGGLTAYHEEKWGVEFDAWPIINLIRVRSSSNGSSIFIAPNSFLMPLFGNPFIGWFMIIIGCFMMYSAPGSRWAAQ